MADIRINALATTAASTASDDFIAIDGSANGTRKLNAFSPTFGGNLTAGTGSNASSVVLSLNGPTGSGLGGYYQIQRNSVSKWFVKCILEVNNKRQLKNC